MPKRLLIVIGSLLTVGLLAGLGLIWFNCRSVDAPALSESELLRRTTALSPGAAPAAAPAAEPVAPAPLPASRGVRLAIGGLGFAEEARNQQLGDLLTAALTGAKGLELVDRQSLGKVLQELELNLSGLVRAHEAVRAGKLLRADWFLLGTAARVHDTNCLVVRLVDARSGITRDGAVLAQTSLPALAAEIAGFVRQARQAAAEATPRQYLALGTFEDLSVNDRQAGFPGQVRGYLSAAYQQSRFTLLERDYADLLLREMELDLGGLTEEGGTNSPAPLQSAFWLVNGYYQSYETTTRGLEITLQVQRIFGTRTEVALSGPPGEAMCRKIKEALDGVLQRSPAVVVPSRVSELHAQKTHGRELLLSCTSGKVYLSDIDLVYAQDGQWIMDPQRAAKRQRNLEEALRAFKTMLLLEPGNHEAKMYLATCLRNPALLRLDEAREYYREIVEDPARDRWSELAQRALSISFEGAPPSEAACFFGAAGRQATNSPVGEFYRQQAVTAEEGATLAGGEGPKVEALAEKRLFEFMSACDNSLHGRLGSFGSDLGMYRYAKTFGTNRALAAQRLVELLPKMKQRFPELKPYLLAAVVSFQTDTNAPVIAEFQQVFKPLSQQPTNMLAPDQFWNAVENTVFNWSLDHSQYALAAQVMQAKLQLPHDHHPVTEGQRNEHRIRLAYAYLGLQQWSNALAIFETFSNQPVTLEGKGPWGASPPATNADAIAYCREKLGLPPLHDPREFRLRETGICFCSPPALASGESPSAFAAGADGLWIGLNGRLFHLDFNLRTNLVIDLPIPNAAPVTCLCLAASSVWLGTDGAGLLEYNKASGGFRRLTQNDGLLMNQIASLQLSANTLWLGYGRKTRYFSHQSEGGLGKLDLATGQPTSYTPSLKMLQNSGRYGQEPENQPSRCSVTAIAEGGHGDVWFLTAEATPRLRRYGTQDGSWAAAQQACTCLASDATRLFLGQTWNYYGGQAAGPLGADILDFETGQWRSLEGAPGLPSGAVTALAPAGTDLWVGGRGYLAVLTLPEGKVRKFARARTESVDQIEIGGGYVWARFNGHLHRAALAEAR